MEGVAEQLRELSEEVSAIATSGDAQDTLTNLTAAENALQPAADEIHAAGDIVEQADEAHQRAELAGQAAIAAAAAAAKVATDAQQHEHAADELAAEAAAEASAAQSERAKAGDEEAKAAYAHPNEPLVAAHLAQAAIHEGNAAVHSANKDRLETESVQEQRSAANHRRDERDHDRQAAEQLREQRDQESIEQEKREYAAGAIASCDHTISTALGLLTMAHATSESSAHMIEGKLGGTDGTNIAEGQAAVTLSAHLPQEIETVRVELAGILEHMPGPNSGRDDFNRAAGIVESVRGSIGQLMCRATQIITNLADTAWTLYAEADNLDGS